MKNLDNLANALEPMTDSGHPPVHLWKPERHGDIDIVIKHDGSWVHEGGVIERKKLVKLFSSVLWFENGQHYLKTPAEQLAITVETTPFLITRLNIQHAGTTEQQIVFNSSYEDAIILGEAHPLTLDKNLIEGQEVPVVEMRYGLMARLSRSVYNELVALGEHVSNNDGEWLNILSNGTTTSLKFD